MAISDIMGLMFMPFTYFTLLIESCLFTLVRWYDEYMYSPLQAALWPVVKAVPRSLVVDGRTIDVFTANIVSWSRTLLVIPIAFSLKYQYYWSGFACVVFHDFLDHLDGIVAKVQRNKYGQVDDPIVGGFMDAFCDKVVNVLSLWSVLMVTDFSTMSATQSFLFIGACSIIIVYEFILGVVRVQDFYRAYYYREFKKADETSTKLSTAAVMEGKLKEKLESMGIAALCVAQSNRVPLESFSGVLGVSCLLLSIRLAHSSLMSKLNAREPLMRSEEHASDDEDEIKSRNRSSTDSLSEMRTFNKDRPVRLQRSDSRDSAISESYNPGFDSCEKSTEEGSCEEKELSDENAVCELRQDSTPVLMRCTSMPGTRMLQDASLDARVEKVYTIGCFDLFHHGHETLLKRMRKFGKKVVVGVHDSRSIYHLKNRVPIDSTLTRMRNVKKFADEVFCVAGTDPTPFLDFIFDKRHRKENVIYIRGDDMPHFPARHLCESLMTVKLLPYTLGVSSTKIRKDLLNSNGYDLAVGDNGGVMLY